MNVGAGKGVGRTNDGIGVGPAAVALGRLIGLGWPAPVMVGVPRLAGRGTHAARVGRPAARNRTATANEGARIRISGIVTDVPPAG
jgi:hypothetical protein